MLNFTGGKLQPTKTSGKFWLAEGGPKFFGLLEIDRLGSSTLRLQGKLQDLRALERDKNFDLHGIANGNKVTLFDCFLGAIGLVPSGEATIVVNLALVGEQIASLDAKHFNAMEISPDGLSEWTRLRGISEHSKSMQRFSIRYGEAKSRSVTLPDKSHLQFLTRPILFTNASGRREFGDTHVMRLECPGKRSINDMFYQEAMWQNFFSLALRKPAIVPWSILEADKKRFVLLRSAHESDGDKVRPLFTRKTISSRMSAVLRVWSQKYENLEPVISLHASVTFQPRMHLSFQFLAYAQALEVLHRRTKPHKQILKKAAFKAVRQALEDAVPSKYRGKSRIVEKFTFLNEVTLADRLAELYRTESPLISQLFPREADLVAIKNIRNYLTHFPGNKATKIEKFMQTRDFMIVTRKLRILIEILLLRQMGLRTLLSGIIRPDREYRWLCSEPHKMP